MPVKVGAATTPFASLTFATSKTAPGAVVLFKGAPPWSPPTTTSHTSCRLSGLVDAKAPGAVAALATASEWRRRAAFSALPADNRVKLPGRGPVAASSTKVARSTFASAAPALGQFAPGVEQKPPVTYTSSPTVCVAACPRATLSPLAKRTQRPRAPGGSGRGVSSCGGRSAPVSRYVTWGSGVPVQAGAARSASSTSVPEGWFGLAVR
jgi:hypothetical protein